ncbi:putative homeobox protein NANOG2 [Plecturocebus cupreus]
MPSEHNWESSSMEQPDLKQFNLEEPDPEHPVLEQPILEHSDLSWNTHTWNSPFYNCEEESLQSCMQFQPNSSASDLEAALETAGENRNVIQQTTSYLNTPQTMDLFLNYSTNMQPEDV